MPTYEFTCRSCRHHFQTFTSISKKGEIRCPQCNGAEFQETFGVPFLGGNLSAPSAGTGGGCAGSCTSCGSSCKH
ncbi:MAG TPA: zinc ribbon domain-containing protein [bacterium]